MSINATNGDRPPRKTVLSSTKSSPSLTLLPLFTTTQQDELSKAIVAAIVEESQNLAANKILAALGEDRMLESIYDAIEKVIVEFFQKFFDAHNEIDSTYRTSVIELYLAQAKEMLKPVNSIKKYDNPSKVGSKIAKEYVTAVSTNPEIRTAQLEALTKEINAAISSQDGLNPYTKDADGRKKVREHGGRTAGEAAVGLSVIIAEAIVTGVGTSSGLQSWLYGKGYELDIVATGVATGVGSFAAALGLQGAAKSYLSKDEKNPKNRSPLAWKVGGGALAASILIGIGYLDNQASKLAVGGAVGITGDAQKRATKMGEDLTTIQTSGATTTSQSINTAKDTVGTLLANEEKRGGKGPYYALKWKITEGQYQAGSKYNAAGLLDWSKGASERANALNAYQAFETGLASISIADDAIATTVLQDPNVSLKTKLEALEVSINKAYTPLKDSIASTREKTSQEPNLSLESAIFISKIAPIPNAMAAKAEFERIKTTAEDLGAKVKELQDVGKKLVVVYTKALNEIEANIAKDPNIARNRQWAVNALPDLDLGIVPPNTTPIVDLARKSVPSYPNLGVDQAMKMVNDFYKGDIKTVEEIEYFIAWRTIGLVLATIVLPLLLVYVTLRRRAKKNPSIERMNHELSQVIEKLVDSLHSSLNHGLRSIATNSSKNPELINRPFVEHIVWSWLIEEEPELEKSAPPSYVREEGVEIASGKEKIKKLGRYLAQLATADVRPESDREVESLFQIFKKRFDRGVFVTDADIASMMKKLHLGSEGGNLEKRIADLAKDLVKVQKAHNLLMKNDPEAKEYLENAAQSRNQKMYEEIAIAQQKIDVKHVAILKELGQTVTNEGSKAFDDITIELEEKIQDIAETMLQEKAAIALEIEDRYENLTNTEDLALAATPAEKIVEKNRDASDATAFKKNFGSIDTNLKQYARIVSELRKFSDGTEATQFLEKLISENDKGGAEQKMTLDILKGRKDITDILLAPNELDKYQAFLNEIDANQTAIAQVMNAVNTAPTKGNLTNTIAELEDQVREIGKLTVELETKTRAFGGGFKEWMKKMSQLFLILGSLEASDFINTKIPTLTESVDQRKATVADVLDKKRNSPIPGGELDDTPESAQETPLPPEPTLKPGDGTDLPFADTVTTPVEGNTESPSPESTPTPSKGSKDTPSADPKN